MSGAMPEMHWYLFWVAVLAWIIVFATSMMTLVHRGHMKTLDLLRLYAEKGIDPPPALDELLATCRRRPRVLKALRNARSSVSSGVQRTPMSSVKSPAPKASRRNRIPSSARSIGAVAENYRSESE